MITFTLTKYNLLRNLLIHESQIEAGLPFLKRNFLRMLTSRWNLVKSEAKVIHLNKVNTNPNLCK